MKLTGRVVEVQIQGNNISGVLADGKTFKTYSPGVKSCRKTSF